MFSVVKKCIEWLQSHFSILALMIVFIIGMKFSFQNERWTKLNIIRNDVNIYYSYLPAIFIFEDLTFKFLYYLPDDFEGEIWVQDLPGKGHYVKTTCGMAILYFPFFIIAHGYELIFGLKADGYTSTYHFAIFLSAFFYYLFGLWLLRKLLLPHFNEVVTGLTIIAVGLATNLLMYSTLHAGMSHVYNFALINLCFLQFLKWNEYQSTKRSIAMGLLLGLIILIRPSNSIVLLFFCLYGIYNQQTFVDRLCFLRKNWKPISIGLLMILPLLSLHLFYTKYAVDKWFFLTYSGEGFYFNKPHVLEGLFGYRKGLFIYSPVLLLALFGFIPLYKQNKKLAPTLILFFLITTYVIFSWWSWWYGGGFGSRPMIDYYGFLAFPLAYSLNWAQQYLKQIGTGLITLLIAICIYLNIYQSWQYSRDIIHYDAMTKEAYWAVFLKEGRPANFESLLNYPEYERTLKKGD